MDTKRTTSLLSLDKNLPLRAYPKEILEKVILTEFLPWLCKLLSLTDEVSANRLEIALPAIKEQCLGMGFKEIKKMFEMYVDSKFSMKPIPNYFDRILLGKIVNEYKTMNKKIEVEQIQELPENEKLELRNQAVNKSLDYFIELREVDLNRIYVYDILDGLGYMPTDIEGKKQVKKDAIQILESETKNRKSNSLDEARQIKRLLIEIESKTSPKIKIKCKELVLAKFYRELTRSEEQLQTFRNQFQVNSEGLPEIIT